MHNNMHCHSSRFCWLARVALFHACFILLWNQRNGVAEFWAKEVSRKCAALWCRLKTCPLPFRSTFHWPKQAMGPQKDFVVEGITHLLGKCRYGEVRGTGKIHIRQPVDLIHYLCDSGGGDGGAGYGCVPLQVVNISVTGQGYWMQCPSVTWPPTGGNFRAGVGVGWIQRARPVEKAEDAGTLNHFLWMALFHWTCPTKNDSEVQLHQISTWHYQTRQLAASFSFRVWVFSSSE